MRVREGWWRTFNAVTNSQNVLAYTLSSVLLVKTIFDSVKAAKLP